MITKDNLKEVLGLLGFKEKSKDFFEKSYKENVKIQINFKYEKIIYAPIDERFKEGEYPSSQNPSTGFVIHRNSTTNFSSNENFYLPFVYRCTFAQRLRTKTYYY